MVEDCDVLVVGAGPTGLALAGQLRRFGASVRLVDASEGQVKESRALAIQARTLEVLRPLGVTDELVLRGNPAVRLRVHAGSRTAEVPLFDIGVDDTAYPFLLFLSQAETEAVLADHLLSAGTHVERSTRWESLEQQRSTVVSTLRRADGSTTLVRSRWVVGCDGARSAVREAAGIDFQGGRYPQTFLLADLDATGLDAGAVHAYLTADGPLLFFPLVRPVAWRMVTARPAGEPAPASSVTRTELQRLVDQAGASSVTLQEPLWATRFRVHHRSADRYRRGHVLLAGDAAHVHSPAGGQGMNTGIQDAVNLGWKLGLVARGLAAPELLDTYDRERRPVAAFVLRFTDRAFTAVASSHPVLRTARAQVVPRVLPWLLRSRRGRAVAFRTISQLAVRYRDGARGRPGRRRSPTAGDRVPDAPLSLDGRSTSLHDVITAATYHLLVFGDPGSWRPATTGLLDRYRGLLTIHHVTASPHADTLCDDTGRARRRLSAGPGTAILIRPDGHVASRDDRYRPMAASEYLARWLVSG